MKSNFRLLAIKYNTNLFSWGNKNEPPKIYIHYPDLTGIIKSSYGRSRRRYHHINSSI